MEPHREEPQKASDAKVEQKPKRFRIVKLEERIAPSKGGNQTHKCPRTVVVPPCEPTSRYPILCC